MWGLNEEAQKYLKKGFPEYNLIIALKEGPKEIKELNIENLPIALNWAKKNGWIKLEDKKISLTKEGHAALEKKYHLMAAIEKIARSGDCDPEALEILKRRNLVIEVKEQPKERKCMFNIFKNIFKAPKASGEIAQLTPEDIIKKRWKTAGFRKYDVSAPAPRAWPGKVHPYLQFLDKIKDRLISLGFEEVSGPLLETNFWNCDALFMPQDHPARGIHDIFFVKDPKHGTLPNAQIVANVKAEHEANWGGKWSEEDASRIILRSQTTAVTAHILAEHGDKPGKFFCIDRNFRPDVIDAKHLLEFHQCEGVVLGENLTFKHLLGYLKEFAKAIGMEEVKFMPSYFPFTEPSVEGYLKHPDLGWIEVLPAGILRPEVLRPLGIKKCTALAWGIGITRLAMIKLNIKDMRDLFSNDIGFLRDFENVML
jgi:phenylalanyl-tRNA synthetase alpha chain